MDARLNSISPLLSDVKTRPESNIKESKKADETSFGKVLDRAEEKETVKEPIKKVSKENVRSPLKHEETREPAQNAPQAQVQAPNSAKPTDSKPEKIETEQTVSEKIGIDDKAGVVGESFEHMAVSYPVSQIAKESLDEKTETSLKEQGLWDIPSMIMAQPSQQLSLMKEAADSFGSEEALPMPVTKPIAQFMASLESELGVKPDRLIQAFKKLSLDQLQASPKETMSQVVKNLNLEPKDQAQATELFTKMLSQMEAVRDQAMNPAMLAALAGGANQIVPKADNVTEKAVAKAPVKGREQVAAVYAQNSMPEKSFKAESLVQAEKIETPVENLKETQVPYKAAAIAPQAQAQPQLQDHLQDETGAAALIQQSHTATPDAFTSNTIAAHTNAVSEKDVKDIGKNFKDTKVSVKNVEVSQPASANSSAQVAANDFAPAKNELPGQVAVGGGVATGELKAGNDTKQEAIRSIVNQAQMLAQKGGGEIRMSLKPDHLGEIQLKVAMEGNRVNVQMTTERGEVKKLIEQSANDLRHGLAGHNLSMDKLDVSVGNRDTQSFSKSQPDFGAARDFANNFHQQQNNRREFMDNMSSLRGGPQKTMSTMDRAAQAQRSMSARSSASGRLNVVA